MSGRRVREASPRAIVVSVSRALRRPGVQFPLQMAVHLDELAVGDARLPEDAPVTIDAVVEATGDSVVVTGVLRAVADCACRRCLERFACPVDADVQEIFEHRPTEGETYLLLGEEINLEPLARDAMLLSLPLAPLCRPDCPGPDPEGRPIGGESAAPVDPRWAALSELRFDR